MGFGLRTVNPVLEHSMHMVLHLYKLYGVECDQSGVHIQHLYPTEALLLDVLLCMVPKNMVYTLTQTMYCNPHCARAEC